MAHFLKTLLFSLFLLLNISAPTNAAFFPGQAANDIMCDGKLISGEGLIVLNIELESAITTGSTAKFIDPDVGAAPIDYVVPGATTFVMECIKLEQFGAALAGGALTFYVAYVDSVILNAAPTNPIGAISGAAGGSRLDMLIGGIYHGEGMLRKEVAFVGRVPTGKRPAIISLNTTWQGMVRIYGHEL